MFDFIVIGSGAGGSAAAGHLSYSFPTKKTLVLEAGPSVQQLDSPTAENVCYPQKWTALFGNRSIDYDVITTKQKGLNGRRIAISQARVLGGCTATNAGMFVCGLKEDYDMWADEIHAPEWKFDAIRSKFPHLGEHALSVTSLGSRRSWLADKYVKAAAETDPERLFKVDSYNSECVGGSSHTIYSFGEEQPSRVNAFDHYCASRAVFNRKDDEDSPAIPDKNIHVWTNCKAVKIEFNSELKPVAVHVMDTEAEHRKRLKSSWWSKFCSQFRSTQTKEHGIQGLSRRIQLAENGEVICAAGAIFTPQLLLLSGIGPLDELQSQNVPFVARNEFVGQNLHDHVLCGLYTWSKEKLPGRKNPLTNGQDAVSFSFVDIPSSKKAESVEIVCVDGSASFRHAIPSVITDRLSNLPFLRSALSDQQFLLLHYFLLFFSRLLCWFFSLFISWFTSHLAIIFTIQGRPYSRGSVRLKSKNHWEYPLVDPNYMDDQRDVETIAAALKLSQRIVESPGFGGKVLFPLRSWLSSSGNKALSAYIKDTVVSSWHPSGSCSLGRAVDAHLRVRGVKNVRVADASVFPHVVSGNTQAACYLVGKMAAEFIHEESKTREMLTS
eukprot:ANDGO_04471.mRNA.1 Alcohol dehydrogenase